MAWDNTSPTGHRCAVKRVNGETCRGIAHEAVWTHRFQDWSSGTDETHIGTGPSWWDRCNFHSSEGNQGYVSSMAYPMRKGKGQK